MNIRVRRSVLLVCLVSLAAACTRLADASPLGLPCMHIRTASGQDFRLGYAGQRCEALAYPDLPLDRYQEIADWALSAQAAGILPPIDHFRIVARLATLDTRTAYGFNFDDLFWRSHAWAGWAEEADLIATAAVKNDALVDSLVELPLSLANLGSGHGLELTLREASLTNHVALQLRTILASAETRLGTMQPMLATARTLEQVAKEQAQSADRNQATLTKYQIAGR